MEKLIFYKSLKNKKISTVLIFAKYKNDWLLCKHRGRNTFEICGGHVEENENIYQAAKRELYEESGAYATKIKLIGYLSKMIDNCRQYSAIFIADLEKIDNLPNFEMVEICLTKTFPINTTYPGTYNKLLKIVMEKFNEYF